MTKRVIIAGTDGTDSSLSAVQWAAAEAQRRRVPLRIVYAYGWDRHESRFDIGAEYMNVARQLADALLAFACDRAREVAPTARIATDALVGHAVPRLLEAAHGAELLVLGSRGRGGFAGLLLGSVSQRLATYAPCPLVVVRGRATPDGPVVAGVGDTAAGEHVVATAFETAATLGRPLTVMHSHPLPLPRWLADVPPTALITDPEQDTAERAGLEQRLTPWREKFPGVPVEAVLTHESAASWLVEASRTARLVVVGGGRSGTVTGAVLGSTVTQLLHHADSPVLIAHPHAEGEPPR
jgi:nucleotide-binding universal stress UspA family protein